MPDDVTAAGHHSAPPSRSVTETEFFILQQVRAFKALHPASALFGRRIAGLIGLKWDEPLQRVLDDLVQRRWLTHTETGGYAANVWALSRLHGQGDDAATHADVGAFALH